MTWVVLISSCVYWPKPCALSIGSFHDATSCAWWTTLYILFVVSVVEKPFPVILSVIKSFVLHILLSSPTDSSTCCSSRRCCNPSCVCSIAVLPLNWLDDWVIKVYDEVLIYGILVRRLWISNGCAIWSSPCLSSPLIGCDSIILWILRNMFLHSPRLNCFIINRIISYFIICYWWCDELVDLTSSLYLLRVQRSCHIEILLKWPSNYGIIWWLSRYNSLVCCIYWRCPHSHFLLEINFA